MTMKFERPNPFADLKQTANVVRTRPLAAPPTRVVVLKRREDGTVFERSARPAFMFRDPKSPTGNIKVPEGYYWRNSPEHLARRRELGLD